MARRARKNTGYVAAKIRANTAQKNPYKAQILNYPQQAVLLGEECVVDTNLTPVEAPFVIYKPKGDKNRQDRIFAGNSPDHGPYVLGFYNLDTGEVLDWSVEEFDNKFALYKELIAGGMNWYRGLLDDMV